MSGRRILLVISMLAGLAGCSGLDTESDNRGSILESGVFGDLRARKPRAVSNDPRGLIPLDTSNRRSLIVGPDGAPIEPGAYAADGSGTAGTATSATAASNALADSGSFRLNFENAEIKDVVQAVLGDALQLNYTLSPDVAGTITVSSARPVGRDQLLSILEATLAAQGYQMTKTAGLYRIGAAAPGAGVVDRGTRTQPGFGVSIVPLRFVSVRTISQLLNGFVVDAEGLRIDNTSNTLVISGPGAKRAEVVETVLSFDEDWMKGQTVGIFSVGASNPANVVTDLERIFDAQGAGQGVVQFKAISRLKSVMVISRNAALVRRAESWISRLEAEGAANGQNVFVYRAKYREARELARIASSLFGGSADLGAQSPTQPPLDDGSGSTDSSGTNSDDQPDATNPDPLAQSETPIDNPAADQDPNAPPPDSSTPPDVLDLTRQGGTGGALKISADIANNSVVVYTDPDTYRRVLAALQQLDSAPMQVAINVTIAEVRLNNELKYGVQYFVKSGDVGGGSDDGSVSFKEAAGALREQIPGFNFLIGSAKNPDVIVSALDKITDVEVLSSPSLMVLENQTATLQVGDQIALPVRSAQSVTDPSAPIVNEIEYRDTGIILRVTPRIGDNNAVTMQIAQEISDATPGTDGTTISKRRVQSHISVIDGQTVVLAGLISSSKERGRNGLPVLSRIPGAGDLFGANSKKAERTELIVLIRPQIVRSGEDAQSVAEELRTRMWGISSRESQSP